MAGTEMAQVESTEFDGLPAWLLTSRTGATAVVAERGATVISWEPRSGQNVISGYVSANELNAAAGGRSAVVAPWTGPMAGNSYVVGDAEYSVDSLSHPDLGLLYDADFTVKSTGSTLVMAHSFGGNEAYPWSFNVQVTYSLDSGAEDEEHLSVGIALTNTESQDIPVSMGWRPYIELPGVAKVTNLSLTIPARTKILSTVDGIPLAGESAYAGVSSPLVIDYLGQQKLKTTFRGLVPDGDGVVSTILADPSSNTQVHVTQEPSESPVLFASTGDGLERGERGSICLAPMSHVADSFNRSDSRGSVMLAPGQTREMTVTVSYHA